MGCPKHLLAVGGAAAPAETFVERIAVRISSEIPRSRASASLR